MARKGSPSYAADATVVTDRSHVDSTEHWALVGSEPFQIRPEERLKPKGRVSQSNPPGNGAAPETEPSTHTLSHDDINVVFQPIVDIATRQLFSFEALTRCTVPAFRNPEYLFRRASQERACGRLGRIVRDVAVSRCQGVPLFINIHPDELAAHWLVRPDDPICFHDSEVYIEVTETAAFTHYDLCTSVLREMGSRLGFHLAVDDLGAGHSNLKRVLDLEPKVVKLDRALITGIDSNWRQRTLVKYVVQLCVDLGARVVAEGIETVDELDACEEAGCHLAQGYLLAKPAYPLPAFQWPVAR